MGPVQRCASSYKLHVVRLTGTEPVQLARAGQGEDLQAVVANWRQEMSSSGKEDTVTQADPPVVEKEVVKEALRELLSEVPAFREVMAGGKGKGKASGPGGASTSEGGNPSEHSKSG